MHLQKSLSPRIGLCISQRPCPKLRALQLALGGICSAVAAAAWAIVDAYSQHVEDFSLVVARDTRARDVLPFRV